MADGTRMNIAKTAGDIIATDDINDGGVADGHKVERNKVGFGPDGEYKDACIFNPLPVMPDSLVMAELADGNIEGYESLLKFGQNTQINSGQTEDIWDGGGLYDWPTSAAQLELVSTSANDIPGNIGAHSIRMYGLDANYEEIQEDLVTDGVSPVFTVNSYLRVYRIAVLTAGTTGLNTGDLKIQEIGGAGFVRAQVSLGNNQTQMSLYTVPAGKTLFVNALFASIYNAQSKGYGEMEFRVRPLGSVFREQLNAGMATDGTTSFSHTFVVPLLIPAKSDMLMRATVTVNNTKAIGSFGGFLRDD